MCFGTQRRAWKALSTLRNARAARSGGRIQPGGDRGSAQWRLGESRVCLRSGLRTALGRNRALGALAPSAPPPSE